jgi:hypothetical protein
MQLGRGEGKLSLSCLVCALLADKKMEEGDPTVRVLEFYYETVDL